MALNLAINMIKEGKHEKASKIYKYALSLDPQNTDALTSYGEYLELHKKEKSFTYFYVSNGKENCKYVS